MQEILRLSDFRLLYHKDYREMYKKGIRIARNRVPQSQSLNIRWKVNNVGL